ncbi:MAG: efflux RND transporter periplasmic adaptor subunit [Planctomyces sp.]|jgi:membrane fusion protein (multidrug efflux system)
MSRIVITLALVVGTSYFGSTWFGMNSSADTRSPGRPIPVRTLGDKDKPLLGPASESGGSDSALAGPAVSSSHPLLSNPPEQSQSGNVSRQELEYDSSILRIRSQLHGIARPQKNAVMTSLVPGRILTIHREEGFKAAAGETLISLDDRLVQAQVNAARLEAEQRATIQRTEAAFRLAERRLKRLEQAGLKNASAAFEIEEAKSLAEQAEADRDAAREAKALAAASLRMAEEQLRRNSICAPFDGVVVQVHQKVGATVDSTLPVVTLSDLSVLEVELYVPVDQFGTIAAGRTVRVMAGAPVNRELMMTVKSVSPVIDSASATFRCLLMIENQDLSLPAGFSVTLSELQTETADAQAGTSAEPKVPVSEVTGVSEVSGQQGAGNAALR